jgi:3-phenylpropionate/trans-cinnamate dioxygenase ferredoxin subunit
MKEFVTAIKASELKPGEARLIYMADAAVAVFNAGGAFYATQGRCTGDGGFLTEGSLCGSEIRCSGDQAAFYLPTGDCMRPSGLEPLCTYTVRVDGDDVKIALRERIRKEAHPSNVVAGDPRLERVA